MSNLILSHIGVKCFHPTSSQAKIIRNEWQTEKRILNLDLEGKRIGASLWQPCDKDDGPIHVTPTCGT